jgi:hypothetical protein
MDGIKLSKEQTLQLIYISRKQNTPIKYKFTTLLEWNCLKCFKVIYIKYHTKTKISDVYCCDCCEDLKITDENIKKVQRRFVNNINIQKLKFIEEFFDF